MLRLSALILVSLTLMCTGCASQRNHHVPAFVENQFERGEPNELVDITGNVLSIPSKLLFWNRKVDNHTISVETEAELRSYVEANDLHSTKVRLNQWAPIDEWRRLSRNKQIPGILRYTIGSIYNLGYTFVPGRLFGGDVYNPYTDTLNVYSDVPALGLAEVAYAKDIRARKHPGWYTFGQELPLVGMVHETIATNDVMDYVAATQDPELQKESSRVLYPRYGMALGGQIGELVPQADVALAVAGGVVGHVAGRINSNQSNQIGGVERASYQSPIPK